MTGCFGKLLRHAVVVSVAALASVAWLGPHAVALETPVGDRSVPDSRTRVGEPPRELPGPEDAVLTRMSERGHFRVSLGILGPRPAPINKIHTWFVRVETPDGRPAADLELEFEGSMPGHGHGFPTRPRLALTEEPGARRIEGVKFNMTGLWRFEFRMRSGAISDQVRFDMQLED